MTPLMCPKVEDITEYWDDPPPNPSPRCSFWMTKIFRGWRAHRGLMRLDEEKASEFYGVYIWEYVNVIFPMLHIKDVIQSRVVHESSYQM